MFKWNIIVTFEKQKPMVFQVKAETPSEAAEMADDKLRICGRLSLYESIEITREDYKPKKILTDSQGATE